MIPNRDTQTPPHSLRPTPRPRFFDPADARWQNRVPSFSADVSCFSPCTSSRRRFLYLSMNGNSRYIHGFPYRDESSPADSLRSLPKTNVFNASSTFNRSSSALFPPSFRLKIPRVLRCQILSPFIVFACLPLNAFLDVFTSD